MSQKYKVYFANRPVIFTQERPEADEKGRGCEVIDSCGKLDTVLIENAVARGARRIVIVCRNISESWTSFRDQFDFVQAAGGVVADSSGRILFIYRHEKWDLPKGKVEDDEEITQGALREVEEECGIGDLELVGPVCETWHTYIQAGVPTLKSTAWFEMRHAGAGKVKPQSEEGITEARWLQWEELEMVRKNTYPSVLDVIETYRQLVGERIP